MSSTDFSGNKNQRTNHILEEWRLRISLARQLLCFPFQKDSMTVQFSTTERGQDVGSRNEGSRYIFEREKPC